MRLSIRESRAALIEAGCTALLEARNDWGLGYISFADAIELSGVPRASAYRAFSNSDADPQEAFRLTVLMETIGRTLVDTSVVTEVLAGLDSSLYGTDADGRAAELREVIRQSSQRSFDSNFASPHLRAVEACRAVVSLSTNPNPQILEAVQQSLQRSQDEFRPYFEALKGAYGVRPKSWITLDQFQSIVIAAAGMAVVEWESTPDARSSMRPTGPDGQLQEWSLLGLIIEGICITTFETDPAATGGANLASWLQ